MTANRIVLPAFLALFSAVLAAQQVPTPSSAASSVPQQTVISAQAEASTTQQPVQIKHILQDGTPVKLALFLLDPPLSRSPT